MIVRDMRHNAFYGYESVGFVDDDRQKVGKRIHEDLLVRPPIDLDPRPVEQLIAGKTIMVTGAGGSIASELCRQIAPLRPKALLLFQRYENTLFTVANELLDKHPGVPIFPIVGDVTDWNRVTSVMAAHRPDVVFHAAAHKHVPLMELSPCEAVKNNVAGTWVLSHVAALAEGGQVFVLEMGDQIKVLDLARNLIRLSCRMPEDDIPIVFTGLRPGEKLFEELVGVAETAKPSGIDKIRRIRHHPPPGGEVLERQVSELQPLAARGEATAVLAKPGEIVPTFREHVPSAHAIVPCWPRVTSERPTGEPMHVRLEPAANTIQSA